MARTKSAMASWAKTKAVVHVVAGVEEDEDIGAAEAGNGYAGQGVDLGAGDWGSARLRTACGTDLARDSGLSGALCGGRLQTCAHSLLPSSKVAIFSRDIVFSDREIFRAKAGDVVSLAVSDGNVELHQNDVDMETRSLVLRGGPGRGGDRRSRPAQTSSKVEMVGGILIRPIHCVASYSCPPSCWLLIVRPLQLGKLLICPVIVPAPCPLITALAELIAGSLHGAQQGGPIVDVCGEDVGDHAAGEVGDKDVEHGRGVAHFVGEARPVEVAGFPGFAKEAAVESAGGGEYFEIEQSAGVALRRFPGGVSQSLSRGVRG